MDIGQIAHALGEVARGSVVRHFYMPPGFMRVEKHEQIGRAVSLVFAIVALRLTGAAGIGSRTSQSTVLDFRRSKPPDAWDRPLRHKGRAHPPYGRHRNAFTSGNAPHLVEPRLQIVLGQTPADRLARHGFMFRQLDHLTGQQIERPALCRVGSSRPSPPATPSPCRIACGRLQDALLRSVRDQGCLPRSAVWSGKPWTPNRDTVRDRLVADPRVGSQQILRSFKLACRVFAPAQHRRELARSPSFNSTQYPYVHHWSPDFEGNDESRAK